MNNEKLHTRSKQLVDLGMVYDGSAFILFGVYVSHVDITCMTDNEWEILINEITPIIEKRRSEGYEEAIISEYAKKKDTNLPTIPSALSSIEAFAAAVMALGEDSPEKAYIIGNQVAKVAKNLQDQFKEGFQSYYDANKELPGGFECRISGGRTTYDFSVDPAWSDLKSKMEAREAILKNATDQSIKGNTIVDENGEVIDPVPFKKGSDIYSISRKK